jgi:hypothetical protein
MPDRRTTPHHPSLLDEIVRDGARQMLAAALLAEVAAYVEAHRGEVDADGRRLVARNGYHERREVTTAAGAVQVRQPRVNDRRTDEVTGERKRFASSILPAWSRKSPRVAEVLPLLYLHGLSSLDFGPALEQFLGSDASSQRSSDGGWSTRPTWSPSSAPAPSSSTANSSNGQTKINKEMISKQRETHRSTGIDDSSATMPARVNS